MNLPSAHEDAADVNSLPRAVSEVFTNNWVWEGFTQNSRNERSGDCAATPSHYSLSNVPGWLQDIRDPVTQALVPCYSTPALGTIRLHLNPNGPETRYDRVYVVDDNSNLHALDGHTGEEIWCEQIGEGIGSNMSSPLVLTPPDWLPYAEQTSIWVQPKLIIALGDNGHVKGFIDWGMPTKFADLSLEIPDHFKVIDNETDNGGQDWSSAHSWDHVIGSPIVADQMLCSYLEVVYAGYRTDNSGELARLTIDLTDFKSDFLAVACSYDYSGDLGGFISASPCMLQDGHSDHAFVVYTDKYGTPVGSPPVIPTYCQEIILQAGSMQIGRSLLLPYAWYAEPTTGLAETLASPVSTGHNLLISMPARTLVIDPLTSLTELLLQNTILISPLSCIRSEILSMPASATISDDRILFLVENFTFQSNPPLPPVNQWRVIAYRYTPLLVTRVWESGFVQSDGWCRSNPYYAPANSIDPSSEGLWIASESGLYAFDPYDEASDTWNSSGAGPVMTLTATGQDVRGSLSLRPWDYVLSDKYHYLFLASGGGSLRAISPDQRQHYPVTGTTLGYRVPLDGYGMVTPLADVAVTAFITDENQEVQVISQRTGVDPVTALISYSFQVPEGATIEIFPQSPESLLLPGELAESSFAYVVPESIRIVGVSQPEYVEPFIYHNEDGTFPPVLETAESSWPQFGNNMQHQRFTPHATGGEMQFSTTFPVLDPSTYSSSLTLNEVSVSVNGYVFLTRSDGALVRVNQTTSAVDIFFKDCFSYSDTTPAIAVYSPETPSPLTVYYTAHDTDGGIGNVYLIRVDCADSVVPVGPNWLPYANGLLSYQMTRFGHDPSESSPVIAPNSSGTHDVYVGGVEYLYGQGTCEAYLCRFPGGSMSFVKSAAYAGEIASTPTIVDDNGQLNAYLGIADYFNARVLRFDDVENLTSSPPQQYEVSSPSLSVLYPYPPYSAPAISLTDGLVFYCTPACTYAFSQETLAQVWAKPATYMYWPHCSPAVGPYGTVIVMEQLGLQQQIRVVALDPLTGDEVWSSSDLLSSYKFGYKSPCVTPDGWVYLATNDAIMYDQFMLYPLERNDQTLMSLYSGNANNSPPVIGKGPGTSSYMYFFDGSNSSLTRLVSIPTP
ncbi:PQQ-like beta-propeller repeat protein [bacterium]|nr:PQQ-like beta-propeller repeat protein [bacterium]